MNNLVIRKLDNYNFVLAEKLDEPNVRIINGNKVVYYFKNLDKFYGTLHYAVRGYFNHINMPIPALGDDLKTIKPTSDLSKYEKLFESDLVELLK